MSENLEKSMNRLSEALKRLPRESAEKVAAEAAARAEAVADYAEMIGVKGYDIKQ
jgi:septal ring factor EnvC (AmiA/AmiB activator)